MDIQALRKIFAKLRERIDEIENSCEYLYEDYYQFMNDPDLDVEKYPDEIGTPPCLFFDEVSGEVEDYMEQFEDFDARLGDIDYDIWMLSRKSSKHIANMLSAKEENNNED